MRSQVGLLVVGVILAGAAAVWATKPPVAVSPGSPTGARIGDTCPTFSWGEVDGARSYELVVYRLGEESEEAEPVLRQRFSGSVDSWTPALGRCLERGGRYAWSVRAIGKKGSSEWPAPNLFEVAAGPSAAELETALAVVRSYLGHDEATVDVSGGIEDRSQSGYQHNTRVPSARGAPPPTSLSVDGNVDATSFTGDGSNLTGVAFVGEIRMYAGATAPAGWAFCDGSLLIRADHPALFAVLGETYGAGDGSTTFALPDLKGRAPIGEGAGSGLTNRKLGDKPGAETVILDVTQLPAHNHPLQATNSTATQTQPSNKALATGPSNQYLNATTSVVMAVDSIGLAGSDAPHANMPPSLVLNFIIKLE